MRVILLSGPSDCGKTTSLNMLFDRIKETSGVKVLDKQQIEGRDVKCKLIYPDGKKLTIITQGDYGDELERYYEYFKDCDILICACNKSHMTRRIVKPFDEVTEYDPLTTIVLKKQYESTTEEEMETCEKANEACVEHLLDLIEIIRKQIK